MALITAVTNHHHNQRPFASLRSRLFNGLTLVHVAAKFGAIPVLELLLEHRLVFFSQESFRGIFYVVYLMGL